VGHRIQYELLAPLFEYPQADFPEQAANIKDYLDGRYADAATELGHFADLLPVDDLEAMQELFTRSFDVQAATTLDVGYVLFGDDYKRGILLANLNREHRTANIDTGTELADYIPNLLRLMAVMEDEEVLHDLAYAILGPALLEMIGEFSTERIEKRNKKYEKPLQDTNRSASRCYRSSHSLSVRSEILVCGSQAGLYPNRDHAIGTQQRLPGIGIAGKSD